MRRSEVARIGSGRRLLSGIYGPSQRGLVWIAVGGELQSMFLLVLGELEGGFARLDYLRKEFLLLIPPVSHWALWWVA